MLTPEQKIAARAIRAALDTMIPRISENTAAVNESIPLIREWTRGKYAAGDVRMHLGIPYKCVQAHDSADNPGWTPDATPALWMQYHGTSPDTARPYLQPQGAHDAYQKDEYCIEDGKTYKCTVDATVYPPFQLAASWTLIG